MTVAVRPSIASRFATPAAIATNTAFQQRRYVAHLPLILSSITHTFVKTSSHRRRLQDPRGRDPRQATSEPPRLSPSRNLPSPDNLVPIDTQSCDRRHLIRRPLRLRLLLPRRSCFRLGPHLCFSGGLVREPAIAGEGVPEVFAGMAVHIP